MPCIVTETSLIRKPMPPRMAMPKKQILTLSQKVLQSGLDMVLRSRAAERKKLVSPIDVAPIGVGGPNILYCVERIFPVNHSASNRWRSP